MLCKPVLLSLLLALCVMPTRLCAQDGWFDTRFGTGGARVVPVEGYYDDLMAVRVQPDGKFVLAGNCNRLLSTGQYVKYFCLARLHPDGSFDRSFGPAATGYLLSDQLALPGIDAEAAGLGLLPDGRIVVVGNTMFQPVVILVKANGTLVDATAFPVFNGTGPEWDRVRDVAVQPDGRIVLVGSARSPLAATRADFVAARLRSDLTPDPTFGSGGVAFAGFAAGPGGVDGGASAITLQRDGKIVLAGSILASPSNRDFAVARLLPNGTPDPAFNGSGRATFSVAADDEAAELAIDRRGRIVVAGTASPFAAGGWGVDFIVNRLLANGTQDPAFGNSGPVDVYVDFGGDRDDILRALVLQGDGKIVVAGRSSYSTTQKVFSVARLHEDGRQDTGFGNSGRSAGTFEPGNVDATWAEAVSLAAGGGGLYVLGNGRHRVGSSFYQTFGIARLQLDALFSDGFEP